MNLSVFNAEDMRHAVLGKDSDENQIAECDKVYQRQLQCARERAEKGYCYRDLWSIDYWFLTIIPEMLKEYKESKHGYPGDLENEADWDEILDKMILLFRESSEDTCSRKNPYAEEYSMANDEFEEKYGPFGEKLKTEKEKEEEKKLGYSSWHFMSELSEYKEINDKYMESEKELWEYREKCRIEAMEMFTKWLPNLWD